MTTRLNSAAWRKLVDGDLEWLDQQPHSLERDHITAILRACRKATSAEMSDLADREPPVCPYCHAPWEGRTMQYNNGCCDNDQGLPDEVPVPK